MPKKIVIPVARNNELRVYGKTIRLARTRNRLSRKAVCISMQIQGFTGYYPKKIERYEKKTRFSLPGHEIMALIKALKADFELLKK